MRQFKAISHGHTHTTYQLNKFLCSNNILIDPNKEEENQVVGIEHGYKHKIQIEFKLIVLHSMCVS